MNPTPDTLELRKLAEAVKERLSYPTDDLGYPTTLAGHLAVAERVLRSIPAPQYTEDMAVVYCSSDDMPEAIAVALSYIEAAKPLLDRLEAAEGRIKELETRHAG